MPTTSAKCHQSTNPPLEGAPCKHRHSLRSKLVLLLASIFIVFLLIDSAVRYRVIKPELQMLERVTAVRDARRVVAALNAEVDHLTELASNWAALLHEMDDLESIKPRHTSAPVWPMRESDRTAFLASDGTWTWIGSGTDWQEGALEGSKLQLEQLARSCQRSVQHKISGVTSLGDDEFIMFAVIAVDERNAQGQPETRPCFLAIRKIDETLLEKLSSQTHVEFELQASPQVHSESNLVLLDNDQDNLVVKAKLFGIDYEQGVEAVIRNQRDITAKSDHAFNLARTAFIFGAIIALLILLVMLQRIVIGPLAAIREHSNLIAREGFSTEPLMLQREDEIGQVLTAFDKMVRHLREAQAQLARTSQAAGRSQVASTVIHNIGNVLTNVNSLLHSATTSIEDLRIGPLDKLARRLRSDQPNENLLEATPDYLEGLAGCLKSDQQSIHELLVTLQDNVRHIHDVIRDQQRHAYPYVRFTKISVKEILEEAVQCCQAKLSDDMTKVDFSGELENHIYSDRSLLLQTIINVIGNAGHAMRDNEDRPRILRITVAPSDRHLCISLRDNGCGITKDVLDRMFDSHFTTKDNGTGLGLHFCAVALKRLGGSIQANSEGPGLGATFVIELPRDAPFDPMIGNEYPSVLATSSVSLI